MPGLLERLFEEQKQDKHWLKQAPNAIPLQQENILSYTATFWQTELWESQDKAENGFIMFYLEKYIHDTFLIKANYTLWVQRPKAKSYT